MKKRKIKKITITFLAIAGAGIAVFAFLFYKNVFLEKAPAFENRKYSTVLHTIEKGDNFIKISISLKQKQLVNSSFWTGSYFLLSGRWSNIKAGTYDLPYGSTTAQVARIISLGQTKKETITILEGWSLKDIAQYCEEKGFFTKADFFEASGNPTKGTLPWWVEVSTITDQQSTTSKKDIFQKVVEDFNFLQNKPLSSSSQNVLNLSAFDLEGYYFPTLIKLITL